MTNDQEIQRILEKPSAAIIARGVQDKLADEARLRHEFYEMIDEDSSAEFINGEIVFHSPVMKWHTDATKELLKLIDDYLTIKGLNGYVGVEKTMVELTRNSYEPDICYWVPTTAKTFKKNQLIYPVPDFVAEVLSKSSQKNIDRDRVVKYEDYQNHQVPEYWIVDPELQTIEQYLLENGRYQLNLKAKQGTVISRIIPDFEIPIPSIFDKQLNLKVRRSWL